MPIVIENMQEKKYENIDILYSLGSWEEYMISNFETELKKSPIKTQQKLTVSPEEMDFRTTIQKLKESNSDAIYMVLADFGAAGEFFKQKEQLGLEKEVYVWSGFENYEMLENYGKYLESAIYPIAKENQNEQEFNKKYAKRYGTEPTTPSAGTSYDAVKMLAIAIENDENVMKGLNEIKGYSGASTIHSFTANGLANSNKEYKLKTVREGEFVETNNSIK